MKIHRSILCMKIHCSIAMYEDTPQRCLQCMKILHYSIAMSYYTASGSHCSIANCSLLSIRILLQLDVDDSVLSTLLRPYLDIGTAATAYSPSPIYRPTIGTAYCNGNSVLLMCVGQLVLVLI